MTTRLPINRLFSHCTLLLVFCSALSRVTYAETSSPAPQTPAPAADKSYRLGSAVDFGEAGNASACKGSGWSKAEKDSTWTDGRVATLELELGAKNAPLILKVTLAGFVNPPSLPSQTVEIVVNGDAITHWEIAGKGEASTTIPVSALQKENRLRIEFRTPKAASPASLGVSADNRTLGIRIYQLVLTESRS